MRLRGVDSTLSATLRLRGPISAQVFDFYWIFECLSYRVQLFCEFCRERSPFLPLLREEIRRKDDQVIDLHGPSRSPFLRTYSGAEWRVVGPQSPNRNPKSIRSRLRPRAIPRCRRTGKKESAICPTRRVWRRTGSVEARASNACKRTTRARYDGHVRGTERSAASRGCCSHAPAACLRTQPPLSTNSGSIFAFKRSAPRQVRLSTISSTIPTIIRFPSSTACECERAVFSQSAQVM